MTMQYSSVEEAVKELQQGRMIILTDDPERENEGDMIFPAQLINAQIMQTMIQHGSGIVCLSMAGALLDQLNVSLMVPPHENTNQVGTPFTVSIEAKVGVTTGVSVADRVKTILTAVHPEARPEDLVRPGHVFPLRAREGGVLERGGHTEGSVDLMRLAGFRPAAVICEIMNPDGTVTKGAQLREFAKKQHLKILAIEDLVNYRLAHENMIDESVSTLLPIEHYGLFRLTIIKEKLNGKEHMVMVNETWKSSQAPLVRVHSACMTGDLLGSQRCDCQQQLHYSLKRISEEGGILIYLNQEGRGMGLFNKIKAYALQESGIDTVEANQLLGWPADSRRYYMAANILRNWGIQRVRLLTNNPHKISDLAQYGAIAVERVTMPLFANRHNEHYLQTKQTKLNHLMNQVTLTSKTGT